jgi:hypothetical protein
MNISNESGIKKIDLDLIKFFFEAKSSSLEELEEHSSGMFSVQQKIIELERELLALLCKYSSRNSIFYVFIGEEVEQDLKIIVSTVEYETNELTKRYAVLIDKSLTNLSVKQLSLSSKVLTLISRTNG